jgi:hypothetical protein
MMKIYSALRPLAGGVQEINIAKRQAERTYQSRERLRLSPGGVPLTIVLASLSFT